MSKAERMRMCLAEAGFVRGRDYEVLTEQPHGGWYFKCSKSQDTEAMRAALKKASELAGPVHLGVGYNDWRDGIEGISLVAEPAPAPKGPTP